MLKLGIVIGTRPEAIKLSPVAALAARMDGVDLRVIATDQHADMCASIFSLFGVEPRYRLGIMKPGQSLTDIATGVLGKLEPVFKDWRPDWLIVQGDTSSAFAAGLAAFYAGIRVAHVEAGLRSGDSLSPWPEEMNRLLLARLANLHFAPTNSNADALLRENIAASDIFVTGNTGIDALHRLRDMLADQRDVQHRAKLALAEAGVPEDTRPVVLITAHRRESFGSGLDGIMGSIARLAARFPDRLFIYPVHPNPVVRETIQRHFGQGSGNIILTKPLDYLPFVALMNRAELLLTDSGGIQEEAPSLGKRVIVMRNVTERREGLATPLVRLAGLDPAVIERYAVDALDGTWSSAVPPSEIYGDGHASERILKTIALRNARTA
jgi:UDP-N-acetylglucosamine 2-epimerase (non-hydrolysing)